MSSAERGARRGVRILGSIVYWLAVLALSLALVVGLILLLEARDESEIEGGEQRGAAVAPPAALG